MSARDDILARIRAAQGRSGAPAPHERDAVTAHIAAHPQSARPPSDWQPLERFCECALTLGSTLDEAAALAEVPQAVAAYLRGHALAPCAVSWPEFAQLPWRAAGIDVDVRAAAATDLVGITGAFCAIAETGTLMLLSGSTTPATTSLLPETHVAIVSKRRIVRGMEDAWTLLREQHGTMPRAASFISGPSRTADIEQTLVVGAHGPYRVHVVLVS